MRNFHNEFTDMRWLNFRRLLCMLQPWDCDGCAVKRLVAAAMTSVHAAQARVFHGFTGVQFRNVEHELDTIDRKAVSAV